MLAQKNSIHVLACGGIGMSALVLLMLKKGLKVSGSDTKKSALVEDLIKKGMTFISENEPLASCVDVCIVSSAIKSHHYQYQQAVAKNIQIIHRAAALKELMEDKKVLLVAGTHGKTTTSSLLVHALKQLGEHPSYAVGGTFSSKIPHADYDDGEYFVAEADESDGSFLDLPSFGLIVTNIDLDHLDFWKNPDALEEGFRKFINQCQMQNLRVFCSDCPRLSNLGVIGTSYGASMKAEYRLVFDQAQKQYRDCVFLDGDKKLHKMTLQISGHHNALNALGVFALLQKLGFDSEKIATAIYSFTGVDRRCEVKGLHKSSLFIDDYGHHPTEIQTTLRGIKEKFPEKKISIVFQPHRFSRTYDLWNEFLNTFPNEDKVYVTDIYASGEENPHGITGEKLAFDMHKHHENVEYVSRNKLKEINFSSDLVITFGAGDITNLFHEICQNQK